MDDFAAKPGAPNLFGLVQGMANAIAPGKRPLSSMTPTIVEEDGHPVLVLGSPGGPHITTAVLETLTGIIDFRLAPDQAVATPLSPQAADTLYYERGGLPAGTLAALADAHRLTEQAAGAHPEAAIGPGRRLFGVNDPRPGGSAATY
jgi:gamma-glutamyltranspeptidase/glutathione hydrolase